MLFLLPWVFTAAFVYIVNTQSVIDADLGMPPESVPLVNPAVTLRCHRVPYSLQSAAVRRERQAMLGRNYSHGVLGKM
ncbi:unnamed protein product [Acanthoscelides obtectus]|uniref:Secreted protein n=1 Tax=Acanthoscelides obtectus TaxID=200917 RepID=A0A9P0KM84_ACAOB|nr:unnamed protein product [Acanthoscelides obtectus]CAK1624825.1 hypothetical protein AOBTE_LOCUS2782 [Acanthoscelides obtectus]